eukprot:CCRYP_019818-RA/>CCRYP_019818-RA protein AED:0.44 eAED:1.00 QI:0/0/0/1/0/0.5/2/0/71
MIDEVKLVGLLSYSLRKRDAMPLMYDKTASTVISAIGIQGSSKAGSYGAQRENNSQKMMCVDDGGFPRAEP